MWDSKEMVPSARTILSVAASLTASAVLFRTVANDLVPDAVQELLSARLRKLYTRLSPHVTVVIDEFDGLTPNQMFEAATVYLGAKLSSSSDRIKVNKLEKEKQLTVTIDKSQELVDSFNGAKFTWVLVCSRNDASFSNGKRALLRPGRMDLHLHLSYCDFSGFKILAKNYLQIEEHPLFGEIEKLLDKAQATPAEISGELMKNDDAEASLQGLINFLKSKEEQILGQKKLEPMDELRT